MEAGMWGKVKKGAKVLCECHCIGRVQGYYTQCRCRGCERDAACKCANQVVVKQAVAV